MSLLLTVTTAAAHPVAKFVIPGVTAIHQQKFFHLHSPTRSGQLNSFLLNHNSGIAGGFSTIPGGKGNPYAMAINSTGIVRASSVIRQNGKILLTSNSRETAFDASHSQAKNNAYDDAFLGTLAAKHQENHDNQWVAEFLSNYHNKQQIVHLRNHNTALHNLKVYGPPDAPPYIEIYNSPYTEYTY